jgi:hypothetical protein
MTMTTLTTSPAPTNFALSTPSSTFANQSSDEQPSIERIADLANTISTEIRTSITQIQSINSQSKLLSINAQIEAARAQGTSGEAFGVVAQAIQAMSGRTAEVASRMSREARKAIEQLQSMTKNWAIQIQGQRLTDLALTNIDLIDRNLYERSCDVRWWATDGSLVDALTEQNDVAYRQASQRMSVILSAYTVYLDLVLSDLQGRVIANGRPNHYRSLGTSVLNQTWYQAALKTKSGEEFGFEGVHASPLVNDQRILAYSCAVRSAGQTHGQPIGVLGILFNWDALAQTIVRNCPLDPIQKATAQVWISDNDGRVLASHGPNLAEQALTASDRITLQTEGKNYQVLQTIRGPMLVAHAQAPGFETYSTGWHAWIMMPFQV